MVTKWLQLVTYDFLITFGCKNGDDWLHSFSSGTSRMSRIFGTSRINVTAFSFVRRCHGHFTRMSRTFDFEDGCHGLSSLRGRHGHLGYQQCIIIGLSDVAGVTDIVTTIYNPENGHYDFFGSVET